MQIEMNIRIDDVIASIRLLVAGISRTFFDNTRTVYKGKMTLKLNRNILIYRRKMWLILIRTISDEKGKRLWTIGYRLPKVSIL